MQEYQVLHEVSSLLKRLRTFNHEEEWERKDVDYAVRIKYVVDDETNKIGAKIIIEEEE